jgi:hypothetical protein
MNLHKRKENLIEEINNLINNLHSYSEFYYEIDISFNNKYYHYDKIILENNFSNLTYITYKNNSTKYLLHTEELNSLPILTLLYIKIQLKNIFIYNKKNLIKDRKYYLRNNIMKNIRSNKNQTLYQTHYPLKYKKNFINGFYKNDDDNIIVFLIKPISLSPNYSSSTLFSFSNVNYNYNYENTIPLNNFEQILIRLPLIDLYCLYNTILTAGN